MDLRSLKLKNTWSVRSASLPSVTCTSWRMEHYRREMELMLSDTGTTVGVAPYHAKCVVETNRTLSSCFAWPRTSTQKSLSSLNCLSYSHIWIDMNWCVSWGVLKRIQFAQRVNEVFTEHTARDQSSFSAKISYWPPVGFASQSLMFRLPKYCLLISYPQVSLVKVKQSNYWRNRNHSNSIRIRIDYLFSMSVGLWIDIFAHFDQLQSHFRAFSRFFFRFYKHFLSLAKLHVVFTEITIEPILVVFCFKG